MIEKADVVVALLERAQLTIDERIHVRDERCNVFGDLEIHGGELISAGRKRQVRWVSAIPICAPGVRSGRPSADHEPEARQANKFAATKGAKSPCERVDFL